MKVFGTLERAQFELLTANPSDLLVGRVWYDTLAGKPMLADGTIARALLVNNDKLILGNHATLASNVRLHRGSTSLLQILKGDDATAEGTMSTNLAQVSSRIENYTDATKPAAGNAGRLIYLTDLKAYRFDNGTSWEEVGSSGSGRFNYLAQANRASAWTKYTNTTPGARPDNFGGVTTANIALTDETTTPLRSGLSLKFSKLNGINCQGQGYYFETTIEEADVASMLDWLYAFKSTTGYANDLSLFAVFSTDNFVSDFQVKELTPSEVAAGQYNNPFPQPQVQTLGTATKVRFCVHVATVSVLNYDVLFDDVNVGPTQYAFGCAGWPQYNLTVTGGANYQGTLRAIGTPFKKPDGSWWIHLNIVGALNGASTNYIQLAVSGILFKNVTAYTQYISGGFTAGAADETTYSYCLPNTNNIDVQSEAAQPFGRVMINGILELESKPTWAQDYSNVQISDSTDGRIVASRYTTTSGQSIPDSTVTIVNFDIQSIDKTMNVTTGAAWKYTSKSNEVISLTASIRFQASSTFIVYIYKNNAVYTVKEISFGATATNSSDISDILEMVAGDYVDIRVFQGSGVAKALNASPGANVVSIVKAGGATAIAKGPKVYAEYRTATTQAIGMGATILNADNRIVDNFGCVTTGANWKFIAPRHDFYKIKMSALVSYNAASNGRLAVSLYKNGALNKVTEQPGLSGIAQAFQGSFDIELNKDEYIDVRIAAITAGNLYAGLEFNWITILSD